MTTEEEIVYKKWLPAKPFVDKFLPKGYDKDEAKRLANSLGLQLGRILELSRPDYKINYVTADKYAVRMRISSSQHMA